VASAEDCRVSGLLRTDVARKTHAGLEVGVFRDNCFQIELGSLTPPPPGEAENRQTAKNDQHRWFGDAANS